MVTSIQLTGLGANDPVPGNYVEVKFAQGPASSGTTEYAILLMGNRLSSGSAQDDGYVYGPDTTVPLATTNDAVTLFGQGSELHRMYLKALRVNKSTSIYAICVAESAGSKASKDIVFATTANANATLRIYVQDEYTDVSVVSGDTPTVIGDNAVLAINAMGDWAVTATATTGTLTITAKQKGLRGNFIRCSARFLSACATTSSVTTQAALAGGTTADSSTLALATILSQRFYNIVSAAEDAAQFGALVSQIGTQAAPIVGIRQKAFCGSVDSLANATSFAVGINSARAEVIWQQNSDLTPGELAVSAAAVYALFEEGTPRLNFSGFGTADADSAFWSVKAPLVGTIPTRNQIKSALNNGLTAIAVGKSGATYITKRVTSRSLSGSTADYRIRDAHKVTVSDKFADDLLTKASLQFSGKNIGDDPAPGQSGTSNTVTPKVFKGMVVGLINEYAANGLLEAVSATIANTIVVREASPNTRMSARVPLDITDILDQTATDVSQVG